MPAAIAAAAQVVGQTVNSLMQNKMYKAEAERTQLEGRLAGLDSSQKMYLAVQLQKANTDTERYAILKDAASKLDISTLANIAEYGKEVIKQKNKAAQTTAIIIGSAVILLIAAFVVIYKQK
jgi:cytochrome c553